MNLRAHLARQREDPEYIEVERELRPLLDLANNVLRLRLEKGWSQTELANRIGTQQANVSRVENGLANPTLDFLLRLASALDIELVDLLKEEDIKQIQAGEASTELQIAQAITTT